MATRKSISLWRPKFISLRRPIYPCLLTRMVNQVGNPAMLDGNMFLPATGIPIWKMARMRTVLAVWLPLPLTVATWMLKSLVTEWVGGSGRVSAGDTSRVDIDGGSLYWRVWPRARLI